MKFTDRMGLKMPDQDDAYQVDDFNSNVKKISEYFAAKPVLTPYKDLTEFIRSGKAAGYKLGDTVAIHDIIYILVADNPLSEASWMPYGAEALVVMEQYIPVAERHNGSLYLQLGNSRRLIVKVFREFYHNMMQVTAATQVVNGVAFSVVKGVLTAAGTATATAEVKTGELTLYKNTPYELRGCPASSGGATVELRSGGTVLATDTGAGASYTPTEEIQTAVYVKVPNAWESSVGVQFDPRLTVVNGCTGVTPYTMLVKETATKTGNEADDNRYAFNVKNLTVLDQGDTSARIRGKLYLVKETDDEQNL